MKNKTVAKYVALAGVLAGALLFAQSVQAREYHIGGPVKKHGLEIASAYLLNIKMAPALESMPMGNHIIHLETDVHATQENQWGYPDGAWVPYLTINYVITKKGDKDFFKFGELLPMTANDGPHYANSIKMKGAGTYVVHLKYTAPDEKGFLKHVDKATGVPAWFSPFVETFTFKYPQK